MLETILGAAASAAAPALKSATPYVAGAGAALSALGQLTNSRDAEDRAYNRSLKLQKQQNDFNYMMWNKTNQYNSPSNQVKLLQDAGINPAMLEQAGGFQPASEVTSADASVPYNSQIGNIDPASKTIAALQQTAQIAKLRNEIKYQNMVNDDYRMQLEAKKMELSRDYSYNDDGDVVVYDDRPRNYYQRQMLNQREEDAYNRAEKRMNLQLQESTLPILKDMPKKQLQSLKEDIRSKVLNNTLLEKDVEFMKKYGISPKDSDGWTTLIKAALVNPDAVYNIIDGLLTAGSRTIDRYTGAHSLRDRLFPAVPIMRKLVGEISHYNP